MWGTVENLAQNRDLPASGCIHIAAGEVYPSEVFIAFGGPQGHDDRMASCDGLATRLPVICGSAASLGPIANRPQDAPHSANASPQRYRRPAPAFTMYPPH
jgi:hypothetical protein